MRFLEVFRSAVSAKDGAIIKYAFGKCENCSTVVARGSPEKHRAVTVGTIMELYTKHNLESPEDSVDAALSSLEEALTGLSPQEGDIGKEISREILLKRRLCAIFSNAEFNQFVEVRCQSCCTLTRRIS